MDTPSRSIFRLDVSIGRQSDCQGYNQLDKQRAAEVNANANRRHWGGNVSMIGSLRAVFLLALLSLLAMLTAQEKYCRMG